MSAPFDTLQLARGLEAASFPLDQAGTMAEAIAKATIGADLATKAGLRELDQVQRACATYGLAACDQAVLERMATPVLGLWTIGATHALKSQ